MDNILRIRVTKFFVGNESYPEEMISVDGSFRTGGFSFGYRPEEFSDEELMKVINNYKKSEAEYYGIPESSIRVKIIEDFRKKQATLKGWFK